MEIGFSLACYYPMHPEDAVFKAADLGFKKVELFINTLSELEDDYLIALSKLCDKKGLEVYSIHPFTSALENYMFFSPYDRRINDSKLFYDRYFNVAKKLGAKVVNIHGDRGIGLSDIDLYSNCLNPLLDLSDKYDIVASFENVFYNSVNHPEFVKKLNDRFGDAIKYTFDIKQANKGGASPYDLCDAMSGHISNFHINDFDDNHICMLPGQGIVDYNKIISTILKHGYLGPAIIEVYSSNFKNDKEIADSVEFIRDIISKI